MSGIGLLPSPGMETVPFITITRKFDGGHTKFWIRGGGKKIDLYFSRSPVFTPLIYFPLITEIDQDSN